VRLLLQLLHGWITIVPCSLLIPLHCGVLARFLQAGGSIYNSLFDSNTAAGFGANGNNAKQCTCYQDGQYQTGSGGNVRARFLSLIVKQLV
jgi:hypothetical protein